VVGDGGGVAGVVHVVRAHVVRAGGADDPEHAAFARTVADQGPQLITAPRQGVGGLARFPGVGVAVEADGVGGVV
jgi:hypothetical protein